LGMAMAARLMQGFGACHHPRHENTKHLRPPARTW
jgi:hypothetical protein